MSRKINFRVWFNEEGAPPQLLYISNDDFIKDNDGYVIGLAELSVWENGLELHYIPVVGTKYKDQLGELDSILWDVKNSVVEQSTGILDKNNKLIYEGDLVKVHLNEDWWDEVGSDIIMEVFFNERIAAFKIARTEAKKAEHDGLNLTHTLEVIGNIHENK